MAISPFNLFTRVKTVLSADLLFLPILRINNNPLPIERVSQLEPCRLHEWALMPSPYTRE